MGPRVTDAKSGAVVKPGAPLRPPRGAGGGPATANRGIEGSGGTELDGFQLVRLFNAPISVPNPVKFLTEFFRRVHIRGRYRPSRGGGKKKPAPPLGCPVPAGERVRRKKVRGRRGRMSCGKGKGRSCTRVRRGLMGDGIRRLGSWGGEPGAAGTPAWGPGFGGERRIRPATPFRPIRRKTFSQHQPGGARARAPRFRGPSRCKQTPRGPFFSPRSRAKFANPVRGTRASPPVGRVQPQAGTIALPDWNLAAEERTRRTPPAGPGGA